MKQVENPKRIATFASSLIGDTLMATSLYQALRMRYPAAEITLLSETPDHPVVAGLNAFDKVQEYSPSFDLGQFDLVVLPVFCGDREVRSHFDQLPSLISLDRLHASERHSLRNEFDGFYSHLLFYKHQVELNEDLARATGYSGEMPPLYCPQGDAALYRQLKDQVGLFINTPQNKFQALPNRQWPLAHWNSLIRLLGASSVVLVGASSDLPNLKLLAAETGARYLAMATLSEFTAVCPNLKALVTTDGGGMHVAATTGVPIISLHGTSSPILLHPWIYPKGKCIALLSPNTCSPCQRSFRLQVCENGLTRMDCMQNIGPKMIERAINEIDKLKPGTCLIMKNNHLMTKTAYLKSWKRKFEYTLNYNAARVALKCTPRRQKPAATWNDALGDRHTEKLIPSEPGPHIFFSPHADDVVLSCGGTIHALVSQNNAVKIVGVFAGVPKTPRFSAFARHLHAKWRFQHSNPIEERWREDTAAMSELGIAAFERWDYLEAPYRTAPDGLPLYGANEELAGELAIEDRKLRDHIAHRVRADLEKLPVTAVLYFPLSLGEHVDHQLLFDIGLELRADGRQVRFYEDYPYAEAYQLNGRHEWQPQIVSIATTPKIRAACEYTSQVRGMGGSESILAGRLERYAAAVGNGKTGERYWHIAADVAERLLKSKALPTSPLVRKEVSLRFRDVGQFFKTFTWHDLEEVLPLGDGLCLDVGCGPGRHRALVESRGYRWQGVDRSTSAAGVINGDACALPVPAKSAAAVIAWQVMEYVEQPQALIAEAARALEPGGVFCGSVSFLEPLHGRTYFNLSSLILERLLANNGFVDVEIKPGLNGFVLMLWTWLRRCGIPSADRLAIPLGLVVLGPLAAFIFLASWLRLRLGQGDGHAMRWLSRTAPLEFAGHLMFTARKSRSAVV